MTDICWVDLSMYKSSFASASPATATAQSTIVEKAEQPRIAGSLSRFFNRHKSYAAFSIPDKLGRFLGDTALIIVNGFPLV
jgi:hypothetical protein